jgi:hypothetical protein
MYAETLSSYFENEPQLRRALAAFSSAWQYEVDSWVNEEFLNLYDASWRAFDPSLSADEAYRSFERVYVRLISYFQIFRPQSPADCWPPPQIFETIKREFPEFSWRRTLNLSNFPKSGTGLRLESWLSKMQGIKPKKQYPIMAVSKFLHFYNPRLFPIYDNKMIWEKVLYVRFKRDYLEFCHAERIPNRIAINEDTATFLHYYMVLASSLLSVAHENFIHIFVEWLGDICGSVLAKRELDVTTLYAAAFEFTVIGAAVS